MQPLARDDPVAVAVVGGGTIGVGWCVVFARAGFAVSLFEPDYERRAAIRGELAQRLARLSAGGLLDEAPDSVAQRVTDVDSLADAVEGATHVQECAPERIALKRQLFAELDELAPREAVLASSSSAITASKLAADLAGRARCLVAHPLNPPYLVPVVELVPAPFTAANAVDRTRRLLIAADMSPVLVAREVEGFVANRLQGALLREAYSLVRDGVASVDDVDRVVRDGAGRRWAFVGPFETAHLNTRGGIELHAEKLGPSYARMGAERGQNDPWTPRLVARVAAELHERVPLEHWEERLAWRDDVLIVLERARRESGLFGETA